MVPIVGVSLEEALLGFGDDDAELHDKSVSLTTSDVTGSQTAIFEYDPQNEPVSGDPPGPWDGYSLFTIDLSGVKDDIEAMQQQIADLEDELEEMQECCDEVVDVIHDYDPTYDPHPDPPDPTNPTIPEKIQEILEEESGYTFPEGTPIEPIVSIIGAQDPVEIDGNDYYFVYKSGLSLDRQQTWTYYNVFTTVTNDNTDPYYVTYSCQAYIYRKSDNALVDHKVLLSADYGNMGIGGYFQITGLRIDYTNKTLISDYRSRIWPNDAGEITGTIVNDISAYLTTQSPNPQYKVRNS